MHLLEVTLNSDYVSVSPEEMRERTTCVQIRASCPGAIHKPSRMNSGKRSTAVVRSRCCRFYSLYCYYIKLLLAERAGMPLKKMQTQGCQEGAGIAVTHQLAVSSLDSALVPVRARLQFQGSCSCSFLGGIWVTTFL